MATYPGLILVAALLTFSLLFTAVKRRSNRSQLPLPPGPRGLPLIGNLHQIPQNVAWEKWRDWCKEYDTDILHLNLAGTSMIVLNTAQVANDLLENRSTIYSHKPWLTMANELMGWDFDFGFLEYGSVWRKQRKLVHRSFHGGAVKQFEPHVKKAVHNTLLRILDEPSGEKVIPHLRHMAGELILSVGYGINIKPRDDPYLETVGAAIKPLLIAAIPGAFLVDSFPVMKYIPAWFPGASFKRVARKWRTLTERMVNVPFDVAKADYDAGRENTSFVTENLRRMEEEQDTSPDGEITVKNAAGSLYAGASDTSVSAISSCVLGLLEYPEVLRKAQAELDRVVKSGDLPDFKDQELTPYTTAIVKETLRWRPVAPTSPRFLQVEDEYKGYRLPAGSPVAPNIWFMLQDERVYANPTVFNPDRFLNPETGQLDFTRERDPEHACWGFGRRICPGRHLASQELWLTIASLIYCFDIMKGKVIVKDENGEEVERTLELKHDYECGLVNMPRPFECAIKPRSPKKADLIRLYAEQGSTLAGGPVL